MLHRPCLAALAAALVLVAVQGLTAARCAAESPTAPATASVPGATPAPTTAPAPEDPYTVGGVDVDITAASAAEARDKAILEAQHKAFSVLFKRLAADGDSRIAPTVGESDLQRMIEGFEIEHERGSAVRYVGTLSFKFRRKAVRTYMSMLGARVVEPASKAPGGSGGSVAAAGPATAPAPTAKDKPAVVLPVFQSGGRNVLWEERTAWRSAWEDFVANGGAKLVVPPGELGDVADIGAAEALAGNASALAKISGHYDGADVVVVTLATDDTPNPAAGGKIALARYNADGRVVGTADALMVTGTAGEAPTAFLTRAVTAAVAGLASLSRTPPPAAATESKVQAGIPITGMADWLEARRRLTSSPMVTGIDIVSLSRSRVEVSIRYRGDQNALRAVLDRDALTLVPTPDPSGWTLYLKSSAQTVPASPTPVGMSPAPIGGLSPQNPTPPGTAGFPPVGAAADDVGEPPPQ